MDVAQRKALRSKLRSQRRAIDTLTRERAAHRVAEHVDRIYHLRAGQRIALYAAISGDRGPRVMSATLRARVTHELAADPSPNLRATVLAKAASSSMPMTRPSWTIRWTASAICGVK